METLDAAIAWLLEPAHYAGSDGIVVRGTEHLQMSVQALLLAFVVALPIGMYIGHRRRFEFLAVTVGNLGRAIPSFGILAIFFVLTIDWPGELGFWATFFALFFLAIPPILANTYVGIKGVDRDTVEAAKGMGMTDRDLLLKLKLPLATPLIIAGTRTAAVQVVATATLGAVASWGGLGRYIVDGIASGDKRLVVAGAILVALLAMATELVFGVLERLLSPRLSTQEARSPFRRTSSPRGGAVTRAQT